MFEDSRKYGCFEGEILVEVLIEDEAGKIIFHEQQSTAEDCFCSVKVDCRMIKKHSVSRKSL